MVTFCYPYKRGTGWRSQGFRTNPGGVNPAGGHTGFDQAMPSGTPLYAPGDGIIRNSSWVGENYLDNPWWLTRYGGDMIVLDCFGPDGATATGPAFVLAHLSDSIAPVGARVKKGQLVAKSGNSGTATSGPHCHIEALPPNWDFNNGVYGRVNPENYFTQWPEDIAGAAAAGPKTPPKEPTVASSTNPHQDITDAVWDVNTSTFKEDGKTVGGKMKTKEILGNLPQWVNKIVRGNEGNAAAIAKLQASVDALAAEVRASNQAAGK